MVAVECSADLGERPSFLLPQEVHGLMPDGHDLLVPAVAEKLGQGYSALFCYALQHAVSALGRGHFFFVAGVKGQSKIAKHARLNGQGYATLTLL